MTALATLLAGACDTIPVDGDRGPDGDEPAAQASTVEAIPLEDLDFPGFGFDTDAQPEDPAETIEAHLREALDSLPPHRQSAYLDAVDELIGTGRLEQAQKVLDQTVVTGTAPVLGIRKRLLQAEIDFERGDLDRALRSADRSLGSENIDPAYIARSLDLKARIELLQGRPLAAAEAWVRRDNYLADSAVIDDNNDRIWFALGHLNELQLQLAAQSGANDALRGWLDLAILFLEIGGDRHGLRTAVTQWLNANRAHPAAGFAAALPGPDRPPGLRRIALLLPLSSNFGAAAQTVYNGFEAAHRGDGDPGRPQLVFYDIGGEPALAGNYVGAAASEGADVIVGPLGRAAVNALLDGWQPPKPMVLLGSASTDRPGTAGTSYQFDLAPEPEAKQVAEFMYVSGHRRIGALYPDDEWGQRVYGAFVEHWQSLGGTLAEARAFAPDAADHTASIKNLFNLTESETRKALLEAGSSLRLDFDARRRRDLDALFMAARPGEARLLKPQINFFQGHDLPVYSTSHLYTGTPDATNDADLDGITFPELPWTLSNTTRINRFKRTLRDAGFPDVSDDLFAFGHDAYQLALLAADPDTARAAPVRGLTGKLAVGENGRVHRSLEWAEFRNGVPVRIWKR